MVIGFKKDDDSIVRELVKGSAKNYKKPLRKAKGNLVKTYSG